MIQGNNAADRALPCCRCFTITGAIRAPLPSYDGFAGRELLRAVQASSSIWQRHAFDRMTRCSNYEQG
jgi:hypothetical protein